MRLVTSDEPTVGGAAVAVTPAVAADPSCCNLVVFTPSTIPEDSGYTVATIAELHGTGPADWGFTTWDLHCTVQELGTEPLRLARDKGMATRINGKWGTAPRAREQATQPH